MITAAELSVPGEVASLRPFVDAGLLDVTSVHFAAAVARVVGDTDPDVALGAALAARAPAHGHVCVDLRTADRLDVTETGESLGLAWPHPAAWGTALAASEAVGPAGPPSDPLATPPLVLDGDRLYLTRHHRDEVAVARALLARARRAPRREPSGSADLDGALLQLFPHDDAQRRAASAALERDLVVLAGGPGTGKTRTIARLLALLQLRAHRDGTPVEVALAAPTGKAAARMNEAVRRELDAIGLTTEVAAAAAATDARTLHRLLGVRADGGGFRHGPDDPLPHDVVVVDEVSMVSQPLMASLLGAIRDDARLVLVGDPHQLASVDAGAVLGDLVGPLLGGEAGSPGSSLASATVVLDRVHRFEEGSGVARLRDAVRDGDPVEAERVLRAGAVADVARVDPDGDERAVVEREVLEAALRVTDAAVTGDAEAALAASTELKVLCATRGGPEGMWYWNHRVEQLLRRARPDLDRSGMGIGRPIVVTANDYLNGLFNGDHGVVIAEGGDPDRVRVAMATASGLRCLVPSRLGDVEPNWAMTVHRSQGSEYGHVVLSLPPSPSRALSRELLYTGITRARRSVTVVAERASIRAAIRTPVRRDSGLADRLWSPPR